MLPGVVGVVGVVPVFVGVVGVVLGVVGVVVVPPPPQTLAGVRSCTGLPGRPPIELIGPHGALTLTVMIEPFARRTATVRSAADAGRTNVTNARAASAAAIATLRSRLLIPGRFSPPHSQPPPEPLWTRAAS